MSVEKLTNVGGFALFVKNKIPFTTFPTSSLNLIDDVTLRGIWVTLLSRPDNWKIFKSELRAYFKIGQNKLDKYFTVLAKLGLLTIQRIRDEKGVFTHTQYHIHLFPLSTPMETMPMVTMPMDTSSYIDKDINKEKENTYTRASKNAHQKDFEKFKAIYPKWKGGNEKIFNAYKKAQKLYKGSDFVQLLCKDVENRLKNDAHWQEKQFIPYPSTYLNKKLWEDDITDKILSKADSEKKVLAERELKREMRKIEEAKRFAHIEEIERKKSELERSKWSNEYRIAIDARNFALAMKLSKDGKMYRDKNIVEPDSLKPVKTLYNKYTKKDVP